MIGAPFPFLGVKNKESLIPCISYGSAETVVLNSNLTTEHISKFYILHSHLLPPAIYRLRTFDNVLFDIHFRGTSQLSNERQLKEQMMQISSVKPWVLFSD